MEWLILISIQLNAFWLASKITKSFHTLSNKIGAEASNRDLLGSRLSNELSTLLNEASSIKHEIKNLRQSLDLVRNDIAEIEMIKNKIYDLKSDIVQAIEPCNFQNNRNNLSDEIDKLSDNQKNHQSALIDIENKLDSINTKLSNDLKSS
jgi:chromosome segregation ATPase